MSSIVAIISLLPIICVHQEIKLINELNNFFKFDYNIFLLDSSADLECFIHRENTPKSFYVLEDNNNDTTGLEKLKEMKSKNPFMIVVTGSSKFKINLKLLTQLQGAQRLQSNTKIGVFFSHLSMEDLKKFFQWCKKHLIINIFAATYSHPDVFKRPRADNLLNIFSFNPFGTFDVINITNNVTYKNVFQSWNPNFQQHQLRLGTPFMFYTDEELWLTVFRLMNATYSIIDNYTENEIDILPRLYVQENLTHLYPLIMSSVVVIVPAALPYSDFSAYLRTVTSDDFFGYSLITIAAVTVLLIIFRFIKQKKILFFRSVADVLNLLMNDNGSIKYPELSRIEVFLIVPLTFVGLVIVNGILSNLQSYLTRPILQPQINSIEDLYRSQFPIIVGDERWKRFVTEVFMNLTKYEDWSDKMIVLGFDQPLQMFRPSTSFVIDVDYADFILKLQKRLNLKGYYNPKIIISQSLMSYDVNDKFPFFERLNEIISLLQSAGLFDLWQRRILANDEKVIVKLYLERLRNPQDIDVERFPFPMFVVYGWITGVIVLVIEIISKKFNFSHEKIFSRIFYKK